MKIPVAESLFNKVAGLRRQACIFIKKEALAQVFSCEFCEISMNTFLSEQLWATASIFPTYRQIFFLVQVLCVRHQIASPHFRNEYENIKLIFVFEDGIYKIFCHTSGRVSICSTEVDGNKQCVFLKGGCWIKNY